MTVKHGFVAIVLVSTAWDPNTPEGLKRRLAHIRTLAEEENGYPAVIQAVRNLEDALGFYPHRPRPAEWGEP